MSANAYFQSDSAAYEGCHGIQQFLMDQWTQPKLGFLTPYLKPNLRILDCGCGSGDITVALAKWAEPGTVTGIDIAAEQIEQAREVAESQQAHNALFETGSILEIPFDDESFDIVFCNGVLCQVKNPQEALEEMTRVCKKGGTIASREPDFGTALIYPANPTLSQSLELQLEAIEELGGNFRIGRQLRELFQQVGLEYPLGSASCDSCGDAATVEAWAEYWIQGWTKSPWSQVVRRNGWADEIEIALFQEAARSFCQNRQTFLSVAWCEATAQKV